MHLRLYGLLRTVPEKRACRVFQLWSDRQPRALQPLPLCVVLFCQVSEGPCQHATRWRTRPEHFWFSSSGVTAMPWSQAYWPFHKAWCHKNDFADAVEREEPKFARWMRKHAKLAVLKDDEVDRLERKACCLRKGVLSFGRAWSMTPSKLLTHRQQPWTTCTAAPTRSRCRRRTTLTISGTYSVRRL